jgi:hypothetical protein
VPPGKIIQAQRLLVAGHSQREIGRELHISPMTVAKIIKREDFQSFLKEQQERLFAVAPEAIESFRAQVKTDGHLAYVFLKDLGIIPSREALAAMMAPSPTDSYSTMLDEEAMLVASVLLESRDNFGTDLPKDMQAKLDAYKREHADDAKPARNLVRK